MSIKEQLTLAAALAVALSTSALAPVFQGGQWFWRVIGAVLIVMVAGLAGRRLGVPRVLQPVLGVIVLLGYLCLVFAGSTLSFGLVPTGRTLTALHTLVTQGRSDIARLGPPVPSNAGLVLLSAAGVGAVAVLVDLVAVVLDRAAAAGLALLVLFAVPSAVLPGGLGVLPFVLGAIGWLGLLLVEGSERVARWGTPMRSALPGARPGGEDSSLGRVGRRIGFAAVGMAVLVPSVVPGLDHRLVGGGTGGGSGNGGASNQATTYNPITRLRDQLALPSAKTLFVYRTDDPNPDYLRMTTLDEYTGAGWSATKLEADRQTAKVQDGIPTPVGDGGAHRDLTMTIAMDNDHLDVYWLPLPFGPTKVDVRGTWLWDRSSQTVFSASRTTKNLEPYTVTASRALPDRDALAQAQLNGIDPGISRVYGKSLQVTKYVRDLTARITGSKSSEYDKAVAIQAYFTSNAFVYDLNASQPAPGGDPLEAFLVGKHGFCEQYATAMAVMLRVAGIPSRVAVGFTPGAQDTRDKTAYAVTTSDAHAWPEAWFAGTGWVRFEPTPPTSGASVPSYSVPALQTPNQQPSGGSTAVPTPTATAAQKHGSVDTDLLNGRAGAAAPKAKKSTSGSSPWLFTPVVLVVLLVLPCFLTLVRRRRRWTRPGTLTAWNQLRDDATDVGHAFRPSDSPRAAALRLADWRRLPAPALAALDRIAMATEQARYAPPGRDAGTDLRADVAVVRSALQRSSPAWVRLRARLFPSSTLQWASHELGERGADLLDVMDDAIAAVTRPLRRRAATR
ncbi:MAG: transglutaminase domain protein [Frankiales bacterium]|nr:transglutaminase domain protein [Frankiales bacterium]